jgi:hypothetical protein
MRRHRGCQRNNAASAGSASALQYMVQIFRACKCAFLLDQPIPVSRWKFAKLVHFAFRMYKAQRDPGGDANHMRSVPPERRNA